LAANLKKIPTAARERADMGAEFDWTPQQAAALEKVQSWLQAPDKQYFTLAGYAGTGKTTLAKHLAKGAGRVYFAAYTGKAAHVLHRAGAPNARTLHSLIYLPHDKCIQYFLDLKKQWQVLLRQKPLPLKELNEIERKISREQRNINHPDFFVNPQSPLWDDADLIVVDEYSMVDEEMGKDLMDFRIPVLALGDPGQLPPVRDNGRCFFKDKPDVMLTEIVRQAEGNPIIKLSMDARQGKWLPYGQHGGSRIIRRSQVGDDDLREILLSVDQLLVGENVTRRDFNRYYRKILGCRTADEFGPNGFARLSRKFGYEVCLADLPVNGDKVVCRRNNRDVGLYNGQPWTIVAPVKESGGKLRLSLEDEDGRRYDCLSHPHHFLGIEDKIDSFSRRDAEEFDFSYALTVHRSQGSQWNKVALIDEWRWTDTYRQWLYTALTRAAESITIFKR
jgi:exodeoxyribonuclease V